MSYTKSLCKLRWGFPTISLTRGEFRTCCKTPFQQATKSDIQTYGINLFLNTDYQKQRRLEMFKGIRHPDCNQCWQLEDQNVTSRRGNSPQGFIDYANHRNMFAEFDNQPIDIISEMVTVDSLILESHRPFVLEVSLGNTCDLKCMYCNHKSSSQWATESLKNNRINIQTYESVTNKPNKEFTDLFWQWMDKEAKHSLTSIGILGGEPLIIPEFYDFVDRLLEEYKNVPHNNTTIWIITNLNTPSTYFNRFLEYLPKLNEKFKLEIYVSIESLNTQAEYIRNGINWARFESNIHKMFDSVKNNERIALGFCPTLTALSIPRLKEFLQWVVAICKYHNKPAILKQNIVIYPTCHIPSILTPNFATYLDAAIDWFSTVTHMAPQFADKLGRWDSYNKFLMSVRDNIKHNTTDQTDLRKQFYKWFSDYDELRKLNFVETFPEMAEFYNQCKDLCNIQE